MPTSSRPTSPHLQVYKPQITSLLSITHRASGIALSIGAILFVWQLVAAASGPAEFATFQGFIGSWIGLVLLVAFSLGFFFHLANGIRHLVWDAGFGFDLPTVYRLGLAVLAATAACSAITWIAVLVLWRS